MINRHPVDTANQNVAIIESALTHVSLWKCGSYVFGVSNDEIEEVVIRQVVAPKIGMPSNTSPFQVRYE